MRILNIWWYLPSFLVGVLFIGAAIVSAVPNENVNLSIRLLSSIVLLLVALVFFWMSLTVGASQKKAHELKQRIREERIGN
jgi:dolichyl-phosphate-mannose--protein O-mannosyl transferase